VVNVPNSFKFDQIKGRYFRKVREAVSKLPAA
jgi:hypothetical protein